MPITKLMTKSAYGTIQSTANFGDFALRNENLDFKGLISKVSVGGANDPTKDIIDWELDTFNAGASYVPTSTDAVYTGMVTLEELENNYSSGSGVVENEIYYLLVNFDNGYNAFPLSNFALTINFLGLEYFKVPQGGVRYWNYLTADPDNVYQPVPNVNSLKNKSRYVIEATSLYNNTLRYIFTVDYYLFCPTGADTIIIPFKLKYANSSNKYCDLTFKVDFNVPYSTTII